MQIENCFFKFDIEIFLKGGNLNMKNSNLTTLYFEVGQLPLNSLGGRINGEVYHVGEVTGIATTFSGWNYISSAGLVVGRKAAFSFEANPPYFLRAIYTEGRGQPLELDTKVSSLTSEVRVYGVGAVTGVGEVSFWGRSGLAGQPGPMNCYTSVPVDRHNEPVISASTNMFIILLLLLFPFFPNGTMAEDRLYADITQEKQDIPWGKYVEFEIIESDTIECYERFMTVGSQKAIEMVGFTRYNMASLGLEMSGVEFNWRDKGTEEQRWSEHYWVIILWLLYVNRCWCLRCGHGTCREHQVQQNTGRYKSTMLIKGEFSKEDNEEYNEECNEGCNEEFKEEQKVEDSQTQNIKVKEISDKVITHYLVQQLAGLQKNEIGPPL